LGARANALPPSMVDAPIPAPRASRDRRETSCVMRFSSPLVFLNRGDAARQILVVRSFRLIV
jgi:hypothetical protein